MILTTAAPLIPSEVMTYSILTRLWQTLGRPQCHSSKQFHTNQKFHAQIQRGKSKTTSIKGKFVKHLVDAECLQQTIKVMSQHFDIKNSTIFETNPGPGKLSASLLQHGASNVYGFEQRSAYCEELHSLELQYEGSFQYVRGNLYTVEGNNQQPAPWDKECNVRVVGSLPSDKLQHTVSSWVESLSRQGSIFSHGRVEQYVFINAEEVAIIEEAQKATAEDRAFSLPQKYRRPFRAVLYPLFFDIEVLMRVPANCFDQMEGEQKLSNDSDDGKDNDSFLIKIVPKQALYEQYDCDRLPEFVSFVKHLMNRLNYQVRLVPCIETLIPGMGLWLLNEGYTMLQHGYYFKIKDYWRLFKAILDHPTVELPAFSERRKKLID